MQPGMSGKGEGRASAPPLLNHTRPNALNMGGCFGAGGAPPQSTLSPC
ncbi:unnamed protein product [Staurois parvus]|uniref:Uncharacterized protein n=1 Tax=Staurois parvus TaxID=386267 RepID=A0ABN9AZY7_9NEOB|nr:unnamed protein product [Staurois parvus]